jgi:hypothetical protein
MIGITEKQVVAGPLPAVYGNQTSISSGWTTAGRVEQRNLPGCSGKSREKGGGLHGVFIKKAKNNILC